MNQIIRGLMILAMIVAVADSSLVHRLRKTLALPLCLLAVYAFLSSIACSTAFDDAVVYPLRVIFLVLILLNVSKGVEAGALSFRWIIYVSWGILIILGLDFYLGYKLSPNMSIQGLEKPLSSLHGQPSLPAAYLCAMVPVFLIRLTSFWYGLIPLAACILGSIVTFRRSEFLSILLAASLGVLYYGYWKRGLPRWLVIPVAVAIGGFVFWCIYTTPFGIGFQKRLWDLDLTSGGTGSGRLIFWEIAIDYNWSRGILAQLFGEGPRVLVEIIYNRFGIPIGAHNDWLDLWAAYGVIGVSFYFWFYLQITRFVLNLRRSDKNLFVGGAGTLLVMLVMGLSSGGVLDPTMAVLFGFIGFLEGRYRNSCLIRGPSSNPYGSQPLPHTFGRTWFGQDTRLTSRVK